MYEGQSDHSKQPIGSPYGDWVSPLYGGVVHQLDPVGCLERFGMANSIQRITLTDAQRATRDECIKIVKAGIESLLAAMPHIDRLRDERLYLETHDNWEDFCQDVLGMTRGYVNRLIVAQEIKEALPKRLSDKITNVGQAHALSTVPEELRKDVLTKVAKAGPVTATAIKQQLDTIVSNSQPIKPGKTEKPPIELDKTGWPIPAPILPLWHRSEEVSLVMTEIQRIKRKLTQVADDKDILFAPINFSSAQAELHRAWSDIQNALPYAVCSACQGQMPHKCTLCKGRGLISKYLWDRVVPVEIKAIRAKAVAK